ncbi:MAG: PAS domain-containing sensor histidine kinase [Desulfobulbaceae bacterium]|nr:PAS domain-containing sensor histidine kinase [Desulfobulbaceae bacterium]
MITEYMLHFQSAILESFPVAVVTLDLQMNVTSFNVKAEELTGLTNDEVIGRSCHDVLNSSRCSYACPIITDLTATEKTGLEAEIINRYGEHIPVRIGIATLKDKNDESLGYLEIIEDISREKELEREKANFQFMVVHDMKSPLIALLGLAKRLQEHHQELDRKKLEQYLASIHEAGEQLESQITYFLEYCRQATGKFKLNIEETDIAEILNKLIARHRERAAEKGITLKTRFKAAGTIMADPKLLQGVFENLLDNAIKFSKNGSKILLQTKETEREVIIQVQDHGIGIPAEEMPFIFDAFHQAKTNRRSGGHGLGLAVVRAIVREHNGRVSVKSSPQKGTIFTVRLSRINKERNGGGDRQNSGSR